MRVQPEETWKAKQPCDEPLVNCRLEVPCLPMELYRETLVVVPKTLEPALGSWGLQRMLR